MQPVAKAVGISRNLAACYERNKIFFPSQIDEDNCYQYYNTTGINSIMIPLKKSR